MNTYELNLQALMIGCPVVQVTPEQKQVLEFNNQRLALEAEIFQSLAQERVKHNRMIRRMNRVERTRFIF